MSVKLDSNASNIQTSTALVTSAPKESRGINKLPSRLLRSIFLNLSLSEIHCCFGVNKTWKKQEDDEVVENFVNKRVQVDIRPLLPKDTFGKEQWKRHFGVVGYEPDYPLWLYKSLIRPDPFNPKKTGSEAHMPVLMPQYINGVPLTLNALNARVAEPKSGSPTRFNQRWEKAFRELGDMPLDRSYWVLLTKEVIKATKEKSYPEQRCILANKGVYTVPKAIEVATCIFVSYVSTRERHYEQVYTRCQESFNDRQVCIGGFTPDKEERDGLNLLPEDKCHSLCLAGVQKS